MNLSKGQQITIFLINSFAMTSQYKVKVVDNTEDHIDFTMKGKRKKYRFKKSQLDIVLDGWDNPVHADSEVGSVMRGNACINLVSSLSTQEVRILLKQKAINEIPDKVKGKIFHYTLKQSSDPHFEETIDNLVYPEIEISHAVVNSAKQRGLAKSV